MSVSPSCQFYTGSFSLCLIAVLQQHCKCHSRISDEEVGPDLVDGSSGASVPQQKAEQIAGGRCLILLRFLLWPHCQWCCHHQLKALRRSCWSCFGFFCLQLLFWKGVLPPVTSDPSSVARCILCCLFPQRECEVPSARGCLNYLLHRWAGQKLVLVLRWLWLQC